MEIDCPLFRFTYNMEEKQDKKEQEILDASSTKESKRGQKRAITEDVHLQHPPLFKRQKTYINMQTTLDNVLKKEEKKESKDKVEEGETKLAKHIPLKERIRVPYYTNFFPIELKEAAVKWIEENKHLFTSPKIPTPGGPKPIPRLQLLMGKEAQTYTYSRTEVVAKGWAKPIQDLLEYIVVKTGKTANGVLINIYVNGKHGVDWHSDSVNDLVEKSNIIGVSFGQTRRLSFREKDKTKRQPNDLVNFDVQDNSLYIIDWDVNSNTEHTLRKTSKKVQVRYNLTFRDFKL